MNFFTRMHMEIGNTICNSKSINLHVIIQIKTILLWNILGAAGIAVGFPLDTVKVRIQTQDPAKGLKYTSTFQCMRSIIKEEGVCTEKHAC